MINRGFTLIEVLTTMTILAIVATIAAPEYWRMKNRDTYFSEGQALFDTLLDARNGALTNKLCNDGSTALRWMVFINTADTPPQYRLRCYQDGSTFTNEQDLVTLDLSELEAIYIDDTLLSTLPDNVQISFFSGGVNGKLEYTPSVGALTKAQSTRMIIGHDTTSYQRTICFNRVSGFPTFNKSGNTCQDY